MIQLKKYSLLVITIIVFVGCSSNKKSESQEKITNINQDNYKLVWSDEFEYTGLPDSTRWGYDTEGNIAGWGNNEEQYYTIAIEKNAFVKDGILNITARNEKFGQKDFTSARLISKADWKYGKVEVNAKLPNATGTWSAIWMMPGDWSFNDGNWPDIGEIDIMEHVGHELGVIHASAHSKEYQWQKNTQKTAIISIPDVSEKFHSYILEWNAEVMKVYVDDIHYFTYKNEGLGEDKWPYDKPFYLILNLAVGGAWGSMEGIDYDTFPQTMEIDFVRIYQKDEQPKNE